MKTEKGLLDFFKQKLSSGRANYYVQFFTSLSQEGFCDRLVKYCCQASSSEKKFYLGVLDDSEIMLLITKSIIREKIRQMESNSCHSSEISIYASEREIEKAREEQSEENEKINEAWQDFCKTRDELYRRIEGRFANTITTLDDSLLKYPACFEANYPGYCFSFYERNIYVINWYPMGGD